MMFPKVKRVVNRKLLDTYHSMPCCICGRVPSDPSHIKTRGSGGADEAWNVSPMCRIHHTHWGQYGITKFLAHYPRFQKWLDKNGWAVVNGRLERV